MGRKKDYSKHKNPFDMSRDEWIDYEKSGKSLRDFADTDLRVSRAKAREAFRSKSNKTKQNTDASVPF